MNPQDVSEFKQLFKELLAAIEKQSALFDKALKATQQQKQAPSKTTQPKPV